MALKIKYVNGPMAGKEITVDDTKQDVTFGRTVGADVSFPDDLTSVSREHFALTREFGGGYKFQIDPEKPVFLNGRPILHDQSLPKDAEIQLGTLNGPKLKLERVEANYGSNQMKTEVLRPQLEAHDVIDAANKKGNRSLGLGIGIAAVVAVLGVGGYLITNGLRQDVTVVQQQVTQINADIPAVRAELAKVSESTIDAASIIAKNKESVYLVELLTASGLEMSSATASVIQLPDGTKALGTNGHVGEMLDMLENDPSVKGGKLIAIQSKGPDYAVAEITGAKIHPGYKLFGEWQQSYANRAAALAAPMMDFGVPGYDVAILYVKEPEKLGPAIKFASRETIEGVKSGDPVIAIGFPAEGLVGTDQTRPEATSQTGRVTSMTTFFLQTGTPALNQLIQHSIPSAGGASGSAIFNAKGEVIGFHNAGNISQVDTADGARVGNAALVNFGQRADMMLDLMEGKADGQIDEIKKQMAAADAQLNLTPEKQVAQIVDVFGLMAGGKEKVAPAGDISGVMSTALPEVGSPKTWVATLDIKEPGRYGFIIQSDDGRPVVGAMLEEGQVYPAPGIAPITYLVWDFGAATKATMLVADYEALTGAIKDDHKTDGKVKISIYKMPYE